MNGMKPLLKTVRLLMREADVIRTAATSLGTSLLIIANQLDAEIRKKGGENG